MSHSVPFYANTLDNTHCFQAALKMCLAYFCPDREYSWDELDSLSAKKDDLWTWSYSASLWLQENGFDILSIDSFDNDSFASEGGEYLMREYGEEVAKAQIAHSDIEQERQLAMLFLQKVHVEVRIPDVQDLTRLVESGYLVICNVNALSLSGLSGYSGHSVVVKDVEEDAFVIHDPGLPPRENWKVNFSLFEKAWAYPHAKAKNILAIKLRI